MSRSDRLEELLGRWIAGREEDGHGPSLAELAVGDPELLPQLEDLIRRYEELETRLGPPRPSTDGADDLPQFAGFRTVERIGAGGMGEVYKLEDRRLGRLVAAKVLRQGTRLVTAYGDKKVVSRAHDLGVHVYIEKPFTTHTIEEALTRLLDQPNL